MAENALKKAPVFIFLGQTGSGKTTIAEAVRKKIGLPSISLGVIGRAEARAGTVLGRRLGACIKAGEPFQTEDAIQLIEARLAAQPKKYSKGVVIDNFPMTPRHIPLFETMLERNGFKVNTVFHVYAPPKVSRARRAAAPRVNIGAEAAAREKVFIEQTARVLLHYKRKKLVKVLDTTVAPSKRAAVLKNVARIRGAFKKVTRARRGRK